MLWAGLFLLGLLWGRNIVGAQERVFHLMGTYAIIELEDGEAERAYQVMRALEEKLSDYLEDSEVSRINASAGRKPVPVSPETEEVIATAQQISKLTEGAFDITVGAWTIYAWREKKISEAEARALVDYRHLRVGAGEVFLERPGMAIDLGGIGKGYALEKAFQAVQTPRGFIAIAGDMKVWGERRHLGIEHPLTGKPFLQMLNAKDLCLSTSSNARRRHIAGARSFIAQASVVYHDCAYADALATALLAMASPEDFLARNPQFGALILYQDGSLFVNRAFRESFELLLFQGVEDQEASGGEK